MFCLLAEQPACWLVHAVSFELHLYGCVQGAIVKPIEELKGVLIGGQGETTLTTCH